jgi:pyrroline-5-carboxylate reductase
MENNGKKLGFIGAGNMATAIIEGILKSNKFLPSEIFVSHPSAVKSKKYSHLNIMTEIADNEQIIKTCDVIILCVKPQIVEKVTQQFRDLIDAEKHLIISICAGVDLNKLTTILR